MNKLSKITTMTDRQIQDWLRKVSAEADTNTLPIALSGANDAVKDCIFRNMSAQAKSLVNNAILEQRKNNLKETEIQKCIDIIEKLI